MPARFASARFGLVLSGMMPLIVSGIATLRGAGLVDGVLGLWLGAWLLSWPIALPTVLVVAPLARRLVGLRVQAPDRRPE